MPLIPDPPFPKTQGDNIRSKDWNDAVNEIVRLDVAKANRAGAETFAGPLTINGNVGIGTNAPSTRLDVDGGIRFSALASGGNVQLCWNNLNGRLASCSSSLRYKTDLRPFHRGLNLINRLQPITFRWKNDQSLDLGLGAEEVAKVEPLLVTHNASGEIEGVKYDRVAVLLINAVKEQQAQIERQQAEIDRLKKIVCSSRRRALGCK